MKKTAITAALATALCVAPAAGAQADPGKGHGKPRGKERSAKRCERPHRVGFVVRGTLAAHDAATATLDVRRANRHARRYLESHPATFSLAGVKVVLKGITDANSDGTVDLDDVSSTDKVRAIGRIAVPRRRCEGEVSVVIRKIKVVREASDEEPAAEAPVEGDTESPDDDSDDTDSPDDSTEATPVA